MDGPETCHKSLIKVKCTWQSNVDGMDVENCVAVRLGQPGDIVKTDIMGLIEESDCRCVNFAKPEEPVDMRLNISCDPSLVIKDVFFSSEAKVVELFGKEGEYLSTHFASSYYSDFKFPANVHTIHINSTECSLKLEQLKNPDFVWIHGILIHVAQTEVHSNTSLGPINMQNVQCLLKPELLPENSAKLLSMLKLKKSTSTTRDTLDSILASGAANARSNQLLDNVMKLFMEEINCKLDSMALQMNTIANHVVGIDKRLTELSKTFERLQNKE